VNLHAFLIEVFRLTVWLALLGLIFVPLELLFALHPKQVLRKGFTTDLCYYFLNSLLPAFALSLPLSLLAWAARHVVPDSLLTLTGKLPLWARILSALVVTDVGYYWAHRLSHQIPFLWRFHAIHHSAPEMDFLVAPRAHPVDFLFSRYCAYIPLYLLGLAGPTGAAGSIVPMVVTLVGKVWGFFIHANLRWRFGPLEWLVATPAFHHWHHTKRGPINRNYSSQFPWVDALFGTFYLPAKAWPDEYGIEATTPETVSGQLLQPFLSEPVADGGGSRSETV
jgi:sterol desaturase/sphingolipid hydroxylase (fatty acid hydroxylase superfamily)